MKQKERFTRRTGVRRLVHRYLVLLLVLVPGLSLLTGVVVLAADSDLDHSFDSDGIVTTDYSEFEQINDMVIQPDGKIVAVGHSGIFHSNSQVPLSMMVARYNSDGSPDTTFGTDGIVTTEIGLYAKAKAVALQPDGKIVVAGRGNAFNESDFVTVRYHPNGKLDRTFGIDGIAATPLGGFAQITDLAIQSDGKIVVAGDLGFFTTLARYNTDGSIDATFSNFATSQGGSAGRMALQVDQKIVVAGVCVVSSEPRFCVMRYNSDGTPDGAFDGDGVVITAFESTAGATRDLGIQPDGKIVVAGESFHNFAVTPVLARYNADGSLDTSFDSDGKVMIPNSLQFQTSALALQSDGKMVVAGSSFGFVQSITLARYDSDGSLDETFGSAGFVTTSIGPTHAAAAAVALQTDGRIVAAGYRTFTNDPEAVFADFALVRYGDPASAGVNGATGIGATGHSLTRLVGINSRMDP